MATVVLGLAAASSNLFVQAVAALAGAYIDQTLTYPALFPTPDPEGPRLGDLRLNSSDEGGPVSFCLGDEAITGGQALFATDLIAVQFAGVLTYSAHVAIGICGNEIDSVEEILADGQTIYKIVEDIVLSELASTTIFTYGISSVKYRHMEVKKIFEPGASFLGFAAIYSTDPDVDFSEFIVGQELTTSGYPDPLNNTTIILTNKIEGIAGIQPSVLEFRFTVENNAFVNYVGSLDIITITQVVPPFSTSDVEDVTIYTGTSTQTEDPLLVSLLGAANTTAFRNMSYAVFQGLQLNPFGNRIPNLEFILKEGTTTIAGAITKLCARAGLGAGDIDVSGITGSFRGLTVRGAQPAGRALGSLLLAYNILTQERDSKLVFRFREDLDIVEVADEDRGAYEVGGNKEPVLVEIEDADINTAPKELIVSFLDAERKYQTSSLRETRINAGTSHVSFVDLPLVFTGAEARCINKRLLWSIHAARQRAKTELPPSYKRTQENDIVQLTTDDGSTLKILAEVVDIGDNGLISVSGSVEVNTTETYDAVDCAVDTPTASPTDFVSKPQTIPYILSTAPLDFEQATSQPGLLITFSQDTESGITETSALYESFDGGVNFSFVDSIRGADFIGDALTILDPVTNVSIPDLVSTVDVAIVQGELESRTLLEVLNGLNRAYIGGEIIGYANATITGVDGLGRTIYQLSTLLRGLNDTKDFVSTHVADETLIGLGGPGLSFFTYPVTSIGDTRVFKVVPSGQNVNDYLPLAGTITGKNLKPFSPGLLRHVRSGADDVFVTWQRRTREPVRIFSDMAIPLLEPTLVWEVDILDGPGGSVVNTFNSDVDTAELPSPADTQTLIYSATQQTTDGLTPGDPVYVVIYQVSAFVGRGNPTTYTAT